ncbi:MAG: MbcA/ParS/Xre antitoxin family protein [Gammaproteobacteria bacterium]|nr:MbcA/ParS/Xre antitoxin family protein [Gammaproteobacteria bacterium]
MAGSVSNIILGSIYNEWELDESDRKMIDELGLEGAESLCGLYVALGQVFAHNPQLAALWPTTPNKALQNLSPLELIRRDGMDGLKRICNILDQTL